MMYGRILMVLTFGTILLGMLALIPPLRKNMFFILNCCTIILLSYWVEYNYFRTSAFSFKTILLFLVVQFVFINIFTFLAYWKDKRAAIKGEWRIPERDLHMLELLGGWSGALIAQKLFRHKTKKHTYQLVFWLVPMAQLVFIFMVLQYLGLLHIY